MERLIRSGVAICLLAMLCGCGAGTGPTMPDASRNSNPPPSQSSTQPPASEPTSGLLQPSDLSYLGAFALPEPSGGSSWEYGGDGLAYYPDGEPEGPDDGFPGSLFGVGHDWEKQVGEIAIPEPRTDGEPNVAQTLRPFRDVHSRVGRLGALNEMLRVGIEYLPPQGGQSTGKLYLCFGQRYQEEDLQIPSLMWCETDLTGSAGAWRVGAANIYSANAYMFEIPQAWAEENVPDKRLATGRFRDGGWSGQGPSLFAIGPWNHGNPPADGTVLDAVTLLRYDSTATDEEPWRTMNGYHHSDEWMGGAWLEANGRGAVIFVGTKGTGECWYGLPDGTVWEEPYPEDPTGERGLWSTGFSGQMIFYSPAELADVARGRKQPWEPQPYATLDLDATLRHVTQTQQKHHVGDCAFDRRRGILYVMEPFADGDRPLVHVWRLQ